MRLHRHARRGVQLDAQLTKLEAQLHAKIAEAAEAPQARIIPADSLAASVEHVWASPSRRKLCASQRSDVLQSIPAEMLASP
jgi:hypothetical protein